MTLVYLVVAAAGLPVVLAGQRIDGIGGTGAGRGTAVIRGAGAAALYGGLTGVALGLLGAPQGAIVPAAAVVAAGAAYLRVRILQLSGDAPPGAGRIERPDGAAGPNDP